MKRSHALAFALAAGAALLGTGAAHAGNVQWSIGLHLPPVATVVSSVPVYPSAPVYAPAPVYHPAPASVIHPRAVIVPPRVVYRAPVVVHPAPVHRYRGHGRERPVLIVAPRGPHGQGHAHGHGWRSHRDHGGRHGYGR